MIEYHAMHAHVQPPPADSRGRYVVAWWHDGEVVGRRFSSLSRARSLARRINRDFSRAVVRRWRSYEWRTRSPWKSAHVNWSMSPNDFALDILSVTS